MSSGKIFLLRKYNSITQKYFFSGIFKNIYFFYDIEIRKAECISSAQIKNE